MENKSVSSAIKRIALGYILIYFSINIGTIDILPKWLGYFMIVSALPVLAQEEKSAILLKPLGIVLAVWGIFDWFLTMFGYDFNAEIFNAGLISTVISIISLYFNFQLITNIAEFAPEESRRKRLRVLRGTFVISQTVIILFIYIPRIMNFEYFTDIVIFMGIPQLVLSIWIGIELFNLAKELKEEETSTEEEQIDNGNLTSEFPES